MNKLICKRVYEVPSASDGFRILVDRLWPRGISKDNAGIDMWAKEIAPSNELRKWFSHDAERFDCFSEKYLLELESNPAAKDFISLVRSKLEGSDVTLAYGAKDTLNNNAVVLSKWIKTKL